MKTTGGGMGKRASAWRTGAVLLALVTALSLCVRPARSNTNTSLHNFSSGNPQGWNNTLGAQGDCSSCHLAHNSQDTRLWPRSLGEERSFFLQNSNPNYVPSPMLLCFDCHDDNPTTASAAVDNQPPKTVWTSFYEPQDVAFGYLVRTDNNNLVPGDTFAQGDNGAYPIIGYYELIKGDVPGQTQPMPALGNPTGGHYWKSEPNGVPARGDKISCQLCHDPHRAKTGSNEAFFVRTAVFPDGSTLSLGDGLKASNKDELTNPNRSRNGTGAINDLNDDDGRRMCAACHKFSDSSGGSFSVGGVNIPMPPKTLTQHKSGNPTPCTKCHSHNKVWTSCSECHGFPPLRTIAEAGGLSFDMNLRPDVENYSGGAGAHRRHKDALGDAVFQCEICHGPNAGSATWHNQGAGAVSATNVNIMGQGIYWSPVGYPGGTTPNYPNGAAGPATGDANWVFSRMGVNNATTKRCSGVACHGNPLVGDPVALYWTDDMIDGDLPEPAATEKLQICKWCHDATPATIDGGTTYAPNTMGNGLATATGFGAEVNGHGVGLAGAVKAAYDKDVVNDGLGAAGAAKECTVCHDARYLADPIPADPNRTKSNRTHFGVGLEPRDEKRLWDTINSAPIGTATTFPTGPDQACTACHQNGVNTAADGLDVSHHGIPTQPPPPGGYTPNPPESDPAFTRGCRQCHNVHGANFNGAGRNLFMVGWWLDVNDDKIPNAGDGSYVDSNAATPLASITSTGDNPVVFTATTGADSFDENEGAYDSTGAADRDDVCATCHPPGTGGGVGTAGGSHNGLASPIGDMRGQNCMTCHDHDYDNNATTIDAFMPSGCSGCHGRATASGTDTQGDPAYNGQYWPDGTPPANVSMQYADDEPGAHYRHVQALAAQLFGETPAQVVVDSGTNTYTKQKAICAFCHNDPGGLDPLGGAHTRNDNATRDPIGRVTVYLDGDDTTTRNDVFYRLTVGAQASGKEIANGVNGDQRYYYVDNGPHLARTCENLVCHNQATTPGGANNWDAPPDWSAGITSKCSNTSCHATATYTAPYSPTTTHPIHVGAATKNYECLECHVNNNAPTAPITALGHGNGEVEMHFNNSASIEGSRGGGNGFYDKSSVGGNNVHDAGDDSFAYKDTAYANDCLSVYCHGGDNAAWGGGDIAPVWNDSEAPPGGVYCGSCHDGNGTAPANGDSSVIATGNHTDHLGAAYGPTMGNGGCYSAVKTTGCHTDFDRSWVPSYTATHVDGTVEFLNVAAAPVWSPLGTAATTVPTAAETDRCSFCHSTSVVAVHDSGSLVVNGAGAALAKSNWGNGSYELPCLTCHNNYTGGGGTGQATNYADGTGLKAPDMYGTNVAGQSGAEIRGHGLTAGNYPVSGNAAANKYCTECHDKAVAHINNSNDTDYTPGNRMLTSIMGVGSLTTPTGACRACHANAASTATRRNVNSHANTDYPLPTPTTQGRLEGVFGLECMQCHDPHGMTFNGTGYNISMVDPTITVVPGTTVAGVRFEARTGNWSFNDTQGTPANDLCATCHTNAVNLGGTVNVTGDGRHYINDNAANPLAFYDADERGHNCAGCHPHNRDNNLATADGFMPVACNSCHTYPGLANLGAPTHLNSSTHNIHAGDPVAGPVNNYKFKCRTCHLSNNHNETGMFIGDPWAIANADVNIRFDPARNGGTPTYAGANAATQSAPGVGGTGVCALLYCHGNGTNGTDGGNAQFPPGFQGSDVAPQWNVAAEGDCGTCHEIGSSAAPIGTQAHPVHTGPTAGGEYAIGCQVCHYATTTNGTTVPQGTATTGMGIHVNGSVEVSFAPNATEPRVDGANSTYSGDQAIGSGYGSCGATYCHSQGTDLAAPYSEPPAAPLLWNQASSCGSCHGNGAANSMPAYVDGSLKANKHDKHVNDHNYGCQACHWPTTNTGNTVTTVTNHVNRIYNVNDNPGDDPALGDFTYNSSTSACTSANCHGGHSSGGLVPAWSTAPPIACNDCHGYAAGAAAAADANNFTWDGGTQSKIAAGEWSSYGHGKAGVAKQCSDCHDNSGAAGTTHDLTMSGGNPYRLAVGFTCTNTGGGCHSGANSSKVRTHSDTEMVAAGITTKRTWPWVTMCVNCHDPHGDSTNLTMVQRELYDKAPFPLAAAAPADPTEQTNLVFTDRATGIGAGSFAQTSDVSGTQSGVCQECHELSFGSGGLQSFHDGSPNGTLTVDDTNHPGNPGKCTDCHRHDAAFAPSGCTGCHNSSPYNPGSGRAVAPNVMGNGTAKNGDGAHATPKPFDDGTYGYNVNGHGRDADTNNYSHGDPINLDCEACHDIKVPPNKHLDGTLDGHTPVSGNANPFHLVSGFIGAATSEHAAQVTFDNYCWSACHNGPTSDMRHAKDNTPAAGAMRFGDHNSFAQPLNTPPPDMFIDRNITWLGAYDGPPNFGLCVSCHNPHGTNVVSPRNDGNNKMAIFRWQKPATLCNRCHS